MWKGKSNMTNEKGKNNFKLKVKLNFISQVSVPGLGCLKHDSCCVCLSGSRKWIPCHTDHTGVDSPHHDSLCVSLHGSKIWISCHKQNNDMDSL